MPKIRPITYKSETKNLKEWTKVLNISDVIFYYYKKQGKSTDWIFDYFSSGNRRAFDGRDSTPEYNIWHHFHHRCYNKSSPGYKSYGGRGIKVCERWNRDNPKGFENFLEDMGNKPGIGYSLDRYPNNDGDYAPENCRWATRKEQAINRRTTKFMTYNGETLTKRELGKRLGVHSTNIKYHQDKGMSDQEVIQYFKNKGDR